MMGKSEYYRDWYLKNKKRLSLKRARLYREDPDYKKRAIENSFRQRDRTKVAPPDGYTIGLTETVDRLGVTVGILRDWKRKGYYPEPFQFKGRALFTETQVRLLRALEVHFANYGPRTQVWSRGRLENVISSVHAGWLT